MTILFHTDNNIHLPAERSKPLEEKIHSALSRFDEHLTRLEVYFSDEGAHKANNSTTKCVLEARPEGMNAVAVSDHGHNLDEALSGALDKLRSALNTSFDKIKDHSQKP